MRTDHTREGIHIDTRQSPKMTRKQRAGDSTAHATCSQRIWVFGPPANHDRASYRYDDSEGSLGIKNGPPTEVDPHSSDIWSPLSLEADKIMQYKDYIGVTKLKFERDENGKRPPPVYVKPASRDIRLSNNEKELIHQNIAKARNDIDQAVAVLRHGAAGDHSQKVIDDYLRGHPEMSLTNLSEYSEHIADKLYTDRMNISVVDQIYAGDKNPARYQRARHRRATGRVLYSMDSNILNLQMTRSGVSNPNGVQNILGTVASSIRPSGNRVAVSDYIQFLDALNNARMRDTRQSEVKPPISFSDRLDESSLYVASSSTKEQNQSLRGRENPPYFSTMSDADTPLYDLRRSDKSRSPVSAATSTAQIEGLAADHELNKWYDRQLESALTEDDLNAIDKRLEDYKKVDEQLKDLIKMGKEYSDDDRRAIKNALLADGLSSGGSEASDAIHSLVNETVSIDRKIDAGTEHEMVEWHDKLLESANDEKDLNAIDKRMDDHREVDKQLGKLYEKRDEYSERDRTAITNALLEGTDRVQRRAFYRGLQVRERARVASR